VRGQSHAPAALYSRERRGTHYFTGGWVGHRAGLRQVRKISAPPPTGIRSQDHPARSQTTLPEPPKHIAVNTLIKTSVVGDCIHTLTHVEHCLPPRLSTFPYWSLPTNILYSLLFKRACYVLPIVQTFQATSRSQPYSCTVQHWTVLYSYYQKDNNCTAINETELQFIRPWTTCHN